MKTKSAKAKGRRCAQEVKELLLKYAQDLQEDDILVTPSGVTGPDLHLSPKGKELYPFAIECKNQEKLNIWASLKQAISHATNGLRLPVPCLFFRKNNSDLYVSLKAEDFIWLIR